MKNKKFTQLDTQNLVLFTMIYFSQEVHSVLGDDTNFEENLELIVEKHLNHYNPDEFAAMCNALNGAYERDASIKFY